MSNAETTAQFEADVSRIMLKAYGITWRDASGDAGPLERALRDGETAAEFVEWWGEKYGLEQRSAVVSQYEHP